MFRGRHENRSGDGARSPGAAPQQVDLDSPLRSFDKVVLAPHRGGATLEAEARLIDVVRDNLRRVLEGLPLWNVVNGVEVKTA